jgi:cyclopropane fatty-acyl-phospholipid synthase-like methyltransferase
MKNKYIETLLEIYRHTPRQGPGSEESTKKALSLLPCLTATETILDIGCGSGGQTRTLWQNTEAKIVATDIFPENIAKVAKQAKADGVSGRVTAIAKDMTALDFEDKSFDRIWSEGAIYIIGFMEGLKAWRRLLKDGGIIAITEIKWFKSEASDECRTFWEAAYAQMGSISDKQEILKQSGYENIGHFVLPASDWNGYYAPLKSRLSTFRGAFAGNADKLPVIEEIEYEIALYDKYREYYS